jgi:Protein of unknown function (DUF3396)
MIHSCSPSVAMMSEVEALLNAIDRASSPLKLSHYITIATSGGVSRGKPIQSRAQLVRVWARKTTRKLLLISSEPNEIITGNFPYAQASLTRPMPEPLEKGLPAIPPGVALLRTSTPDNSYLAAAKEIFSLLDAPSGYVHATSQRSFAAAELGYLAMAPYKQPPPLLPDGSHDLEAGRAWLNWKHEEDTNDRVRQTEFVQSHIGPRLRGTYWGTLLGREMVEELGGQAHVRQHAPVVLAESLENGGMYLQLTATPEPITTPDMQRGLIALEQFLAPVLAPMPPYFATRQRNG